MKIKPPKIFLDSGNPEETKKAKGLIGHLDGQTTNPSLVAKNPDIQAFLQKGKKLTEEDLLGRYKEIIETISKEIAGHISIEVYANWDTSVENMIKQAEEMTTWSKSAYIKFPTIPAGLEAASRFIKNGGRVNMTLVFDQHQAAAVYAATKGSKNAVCISPFIGRWDDRGYEGLDVIKNIIKMYKNFEKKTNEHTHVELLAASIRNLRHLYASIWMGVDIVTLPLPIIRDWVEEQKWVPDKKYRYESKGLKSIVYKDLPFRTDFTQYEISKEKGTLLDEGVQKFVKDWESLIQK